MDMFEWNKLDAPVFFVLDTSEDMRGEKIDRLNEVMEQITDVMARAEEAPDARLRQSISVLEVNREARWAVKSRPLDGRFRWTPLTAGGRRELGPALEKLREGLAAMDRMPIDPLIMFILGGRAEDDWVQAMLRLWEEPRYKKAVKAGIRLDERAADTLAALTGSTEAVLSAESQNQERFFFDLLESGRWLRQLLD